MPDNAIPSRAAIDLKSLAVYCIVCGNQIGRRWSKCIPAYADHKIGDPTKGEIRYRRSSSGGMLTGGMRVEP